MSMLQWTKYATYKDVVQANGTTERLYRASSGPAPRVGPDGRWTLDGFLAQLATESPAIAMKVARKLESALGIIFNTGAWGDVVAPGATISKAKVDAQFAAQFCTQGSEVQKLVLAGKADEAREICRKQLATGKDADRSSTISKAEYDALRDVNAALYEPALAAFAKALGL